MSHEITACRRKWQLMKSPRSRSHRQRELGSEILNTKSHFWFGSWWNSEPKNPRMFEPMSETRTGFDTTDDGHLFAAWQADPGCEEARWAQRLVWRSETMMPGCSAAAKMDWPKLGLIKSQGWRCRSADIINTKMIMVEQFGSVQADQFTPPVWSWGPIEIEQSCEHLAHRWET